VDGWTDKTGVRKTFPEKFPKKFMKYRDYPSIRPPAAGMAMPRPASTECPRRAARSAGALNMVALLCGHRDVADGGVAIARKRRLCLSADRPYRRHRIPAVARTSGCSGCHRRGRGQSRSSRIWFFSSTDVATGLMPVGGGGRTGGDLRHGGKPCVPQELTSILGGRLRSADPSFCSAPDKRCCGAAFRS